MGNFVLELGLNCIDISVHGGDFGVHRGDFGVHLDNLGVQFGYLAFHQGQISLGREPRGRFLDAAANRHGYSLGLRLPHSRFLDPSGDGQAVVRSMLHYLAPYQQNECFFSNQFRSFREKHLNSGEKI